MPLNKDRREFFELWSSNGGAHSRAGARLSNEDGVETSLDPAGTSACTRYSAIFTVSESGRLREDAPTQNL